MVDREPLELSVRRQCELLRVSRSGLYYEPEPTREEELALMRRIDEIHLKRPLKYPYLLRSLVISRVNQVWATEITYIPMKAGFVYLVAIMDWLSWRKWRATRSCCPRVSVAKASDTGKCDDLARARRLGSARNRRIAPKRHMRSILVVVGDVVTDQAEQMPLPEDNDVVEQLAAAMLTRDAGQPRNAGSIATVCNCATPPREAG
jgi:putative transposase